MDSIEDRAKRWAGVLARERGRPSDHEAWLLGTLELIEAEAAKQALKDGLNPEDSRVTRVYVRPLILRYWRQHMKGGRGGADRQGNRPVTAIEAAWRLGQKAGLLPDE